MHDKSPINVEHIMESIKSRYIEGQFPNTRIYRSTYKATFHKIQIHIVHYLKAYFFDTFAYRFQHLQNLFVVRLCRVMLGYVRLR